MDNGVFSELEQSGLHFRTAEFLSELGEEHPGRDFIPELAAIVGKLPQEFSNADEYPWAASCFSGRLRTALAGKNGLKLPLLLHSLFPFIREKALRSNNDDLDSLARKIVEFAEEEKHKSDHYDAILEIDSNIERIILGEIIRNPSINKAVILDELLDKAKKNIAILEGLEISVEARVRSAAESMAQWKKNWGFVELSKGFCKIHEEKIRQSWYALAALLMFGGALFVPPLYHIVENKMHSLTAENMLGIVPFVAAEFILLYFFRIALQNRKSVKAQLLQIELRIALIQFVQEYANFSQRNNIEGLRGFESLIFSGIVADEKAIPSFFDGTEQIAKLIREMKEK